MSDAAIVPTINMGGTTASLLLLATIVELLLKHGEVHVKNVATSEQLGDSFVLGMELQKLLDAKAAK